MKLLLLLLSLTPAISQADYNSQVLSAVKSMSHLKGKYALTGTAVKQLRQALSVEDGQLVVRPDDVSQSFCTSATYLVFIKVISEANPHLDPKVIQSLMVKGQPDGQGIWGRWNANGPGTARLFNELDLGNNYTRMSEGKPGDFMKIFWNDEIGKHERGHSVVYLGSFTKNGTEYVRFWSSNTGMGMGYKTVTRSSIRRVIFSRLESPQNVARAPAVPYTDRYLASMLSTASSPSTLYEKIGVSQGGT